MSTGPGDRAGAGRLARARRRAAAVLMGTGRKSWFILVIVLAWWLITAAGWVDPYKLPSPGDVVATLGTLFTERALFADLIATVLRLVEGWAIGVVAGVLLGILTGTSRLLEDGIRPVIAGLQAVPTIAFLPLAILWLGFDGSAVLAITAFGTFKPMALATYGAMHQIPPTLLMAGRALGARGLFMQRTLIFPAIVPNLVTGLKMGWSFAWRALMAAEIVVTGAAGLGGVLELGREIGAIDVVMAVILVILVVGIATEQLFFTRLERWVNRRWGLVGAR